MTVCNFFLEDIVMYLETQKCTCLGRTHWSNQGQIAYIGNILNTATAACSTLLEQDRHMDCIEHQ